MGFHKRGQLKRAAKSQLPRVQYHLVNVLDCEVHVNLTYVSIYVTWLVVRDP